MANPASNEQILEAALSVIVRRGYAGATTREIAAEAGINEVTLFRRFGSKAKLLEAVVAEEAARFASSGISYSGDIRADLCAVLLFYRGLMEHRGPIVLAIMGEVTRNPDLLPIMEIPLGLMHRVGEILGRYQAAGLLAEEPIHETVAALLGPLFLATFTKQMMRVQGDVGDVGVQVDRFLHGRLRAVDETG